MTKGCYTIFNNINSDEYTEQEKLHSIKDILCLATHNSINKQSIINAFRWLYGYCLEEAKAPQTNADRIRNMTDEELAEFWANETICEHCIHDNNQRCDFDTVCTRSYAEAMAFKWLMKEVE